MRLFYDTERSSVIGLKTMFDIMAFASSLHSLTSPLTIILLISVEPSLKIHFRKSIRCPLVKLQLPTHNSFKCCLLHNEWIVGDSLLAIKVWKLEVVKVSGLMWPSDLFICIWCSSRCFIRNLKTPFSFICTYGKFLK